MNLSQSLPTVPTFITVHLGSASSSAQNVTVSFADYIKNVASSEIYPTWPEEALRANILAQISFALNRVYSEYYRSRGYDFDITNSTASDQSFVNGRDIFDNISRIVDEIFNDYIVRRGSVEPLFAAYCDGERVSCNGLSQWGSVALAQRGMSALDILMYYYGTDIELVEDAPISERTESFPGRVLAFGSAGNEVRSVQIRLRRISTNYPSIPKIPSADGIFGTETVRAVEEYQRIFSLNVDGIVGRATWYSIIRIYNAVKRISELSSEGIPLEDVTDIFESELGVGDTGADVRELQYFLTFVGIFNDYIPRLTIDGVFGSRTESAVRAFEQAYGLEVTGRVDSAFWDTLYSAYRGMTASLDALAMPREVVLYPGTPQRQGSEGEDVRALQAYLAYIATTYTEIPAPVADGVFGSATERAVRAYQRVFDLEETGVVGSVTWNSILDTYLTLSIGDERVPGQYEMQ